MGEMAGNTYRLSSVCRLIDCSRQFTVSSARGDITYKKISTSIDRRRGSLNLGFFVTEATFCQQKNTFRSAENTHK